MHHREGERDWGAARSGSLKKQWLIETDPTLVVPSTLEGQVTRDGRV